MTDEKFRGNKRGPIGPRVVGTQGGFLEPFPVSREQSTNILNQPIADDTWEKIEAIWRVYLRRSSEFGAPKANANPNDPHSYEANREKIEKQFDRLFADFPGNSTDREILAVISDNGSRALQMPDSGENAFRRIMDEANHLLEIAQAIVLRAENPKTIVPEHPADLAMETVSNLYHALESAGIEILLSPTTAHSESHVSDWSRLTPFEKFLRETELAGPSASPAAFTRWVDKAIIKTR